MTQTFPDVKDWPETAPIGHNKAPLEESVTAEFEEAVAVAGLVWRIQEITEAAGRAPEVEDDETAGKVGDLIAQAKEADKAVEAEREILNRPLLNAQRALKGKADGLTAPMEAAVAPLRGRLDEYMAGREAVHGEMGARVGIRETYDFKVESYAKLPKDIRQHPTVLEAINKVIRALVKGGARKIAGVQIFPVTKATVR